MRARYLRSSLAAVLLAGALIVACTDESPVTDSDTTQVTPDGITSSDGLAHDTVGPSPDSVDTVEEEPCAPDTCDIDGVCVDNEAPNPDNPCEFCLVLVDQRAWTPNDGGFCDDGLICTPVDACEGGACVGESKDCSDDNSCTSDICDPTTGTCLYDFIIGECEDGNACTTDDTCAGEACVGGPPLTCDDGQACTSDSCDAKIGCIYPLNTGDPCDDGNICTTGDACAGGVCKGGAALNCDDDNLCTVEACVAGTGCIYHDVAAVCVDDNICTSESCHPVQGCIFPFNTLPCNDGSLCTVADICTMGACIGAPVDPDDGNLCTDDACEPSVGPINAPNVLPCNDGNACTVGDTCALSACAPGSEALDCGDGEICTTDACNPAEGCANISNNLFCDDGDACTQDDICGGGACAGAPVDCDDDNECTTDACDEGDGSCDHTVIPSNGCRPVFDVTWPPRAATLEGALGDVVFVQGSVASGAGDIANLTLNGDTAFVQTDGSFLVAFDPTIGGNTLVLEATDTQGTSRRHVQAFHWGHDFHLPTTPKNGMVDPGLALFMSKDVIDDGVHTQPPDDLATIFEMVLGTFDLDTLIPNPAATGINAGIGTYDIYISNISSPPASVVLSSGAGKLDMVVVLANINADVLADKTCSWGWSNLTCVGPDPITGTIHIQTITISAEVVLGVTNSHALTATPENVFVSISGLTTAIDGAFGWLAEFILGFFQGDLVSSMEDAFEDTIEDELAPVLTDALSSLAFDMSLALPSFDPSGGTVTVDLITDFSQVTVNTQGMAMALRAGVYATETVPYQNLGSVARGGCGTGVQPLVIPKASPLELVLSDDTLNEMLYAGWRGGLLEFDVDPAVLTEVDLTIYGVEDLTVTISGMLAPVISDCYAGGELRVHIGDLSVNAQVLLLGQAIEVQMYISMETTVDLVVSDGNVGLAIGELDEDSVEVQVSIVQEELIGFEPVIDELMFDTLLPELLSNITDVNAFSFPLPEVDLSGAMPGIPGGAVIAIDAQSISRANGNTIVSGDLK